MRTFELLTIIANFPMVAWPFHWRDKRHQWELILPALGLPFALLQILIEGYRWQMIPVYALTAGGTVLAIWLFNNDQATSGTLNTKWLLVATIGILSFLCIALSVLLGTALPIPNPPEISGPYAVGTTTYYLVDDAREEIYGSEPGGPRELMVQVWYPAEFVPNGKRASVITDVNKFYPALANYLDLPRVMLSHLSLAKGNAVIDAPLADSDEPYPVIVFSHGWNGFREQNIYQAEELASHGYVVVAPSHTYGALATIFPDGRVVLNDPTALDGDDGNIAAARNKLVSQWADDLSFVLDEMEKRNQNDPNSLFTGHLALQRVGAMGHSTGGGAVVQFCDQDTRCAALLGMDTWLEPLTAQEVAAGTDKPVLLMHSETWKTADDPNTKLTSEYFAAAQSDKYQLTIAGSGHEDFTLIAMFSPLAANLGLKGTIPGERSFEIINAYTVAFFDQALRAKPQPLLEGPPVDFEEVAFMNGH
jgi:dienelactone hydrolase